MGSMLSAAPWWIAALFWLGTAIGVGAISFISYALTDGFFKWVVHLIYIYRYKHRFGKPPTAKCYCKDCENWYPHSPQATEGRCWRFENRTMADNWFCWDAEPRETERK